MTEKQKTGAEIFTIFADKFSESADNYAETIREARFALDEAKRKSKSRASDAAVRQRMLEAEADRNFRHDGLRKYLVSQVVSARNEAESNNVLTISERAQIVEYIDAAGAALDDLRRVHANMGEATKDLADEVFCMNLQDMFALCYEVIKVNFGGMVEKIVDKVKNRNSAEQEN